MDDSRRARGTYNDLNWRCLHTPARSWKDITLYDSPQRSQPAASTLGRRLLGPSAYLCCDPLAMIHATRVVDVEKAPSNSLFFLPSLIPGKGPRGLGPESLDQCSFWTRRTGTAVPRKYWRSRLWQTGSSHGQPRSLACVCSPRAECIPPIKIKLTILNFVSTSSNAS